MLICISATEDDPVKKKAKKKNLVILGATGSIGSNALEVCRALQEKVSVVGLAAANSWSELAGQAVVTGCGQIAIANPEQVANLQGAAPKNCRVLSGESGLIELCIGPEVDMVLCAIAGTAGLKPVLAAIEGGKDIALASKEILVMAGALVMAAARRKKVRIIPVDSEHSAIFQCLQGEDGRYVKRLHLTASGGPFRDYTEAQLQAVTYQDALAHPTWRMGPKVTIDSATLMNKGLEMIEAHWLFDMDIAAIEVILHPQSIVHSMVEMIDGSVLAQLAKPDMKLPIQYALIFPERSHQAFSSLDMYSLGKLEFFPPREKLFPALSLARRAIEVGGTLPTVYNAANEVAVENFRRGLIGFLDIPRQVEARMNLHSPTPADNLQTVLQADAWAREKIEINV